MMLRRIPCALIAICLSSAAAFAADDSLLPVRSAAVAADANESTRPTESLRLPSPIHGWQPPQRPAALPILYAGYAALQTFDVVSTTRGLHSGATEANPFMKQIVARPAVFWATKAAGTILPIMIAERYWKTNKVRAIAIMAVSNGVMATIAANNAKVLKQMR